MADVVSANMFGGYAQRGDFALRSGIFIGKKPWNSHGVQRSRVELRDCEGSESGFSVFDPRVSETAEMLTFIFNSNQEPTHGR